jgi:hypothetical protein
VVLAAYEDLRARLGRRPTAGELLRKGHNPSVLRATYGSWFAFVLAQGDLSEEEQAVATQCAAFLADIERTEANRAFKLVALEAFVNLDGLGPDGASVKAIAEESWRILERRSELRSEVLEDARPDGTEAGMRRFVTYWAKNPIRAWSGTKRGQRTEFELRGERLHARVSIDPARRATLGAMLCELADYRTLSYRQSAAQREDGFRCKVIRNASHEPILKLPTTQSSPGERDVRLPNGDVWIFRFAKEFCNVAHPPGIARNKLGDLLRSWFGPNVGAPGRQDVVRFYAR